MMALRPGAVSGCLPAGLYFDPFWAWFVEAGVLVTYPHPPGTCGGFRSHLIDCRVGVID